MQQLRLIPAKAKPVNLETSVKFIESLKGRDKALRFVQYFSRFLMYQLFQLDPKSDLAARLQLLYKGLGTHRKAFKLGTFMDEYLKFQKALSETKEDLKKHLTIALRFFMGIFLVYDNLVWATSLKIIKTDGDAIKKRSYWLRLIAAVINTMIVSISITETQEKLAKCDKKDLVQLEEKQSSNFIDMLKNACDVLTYANSAELIKNVTGSSFTDGTAGLVGAVSSFAGGFQVWVAM